MAQEALSAERNVLTSQQLAETQRANIAREQETERSNLAREQETKRHNERSEAIDIAGTVIRGVDTLSSVLNRGAQTAAALISILG